MQSNSKKQASIFSLFATIAIIIVVIAYVGISVNTTDPLWFLTVFAEIPKKIEIDCHGEQVILLPEDDHFEALYLKANEIISGKKNWDRLYMSEDTYEYYRTSKDVIVLEMFYPQTVKIHSIYKYYKNIEQLIIPLQGRHSEKSLLFGINNGTPVSGAMNIEPITPLLDYVTSNGLCVQE